MHVTATAISQRIRALEAVTGSLLERTLSADLPRLAPGPATLRIAVNADSLATWVIPALAAGPRWTWRCTDNSPGWRA